MEPVNIMIDDLARQVAQKAIESAEWKARALSAEAALKEVTEDTVEETEETDEESG